MPPSMISLRRYLLLALASIVGCSEPGSDNHTDYDTGGQVTSTARPASQTDQQQILFGDLHVHTTYSMDAFEKSQSFAGGDGAHPPADACDYARFCSQLDFWSINDHGEFLNPERWQKTKQAIRQCNAVAGNEDNPDTVAFLGWEWTQIGPTPETHYGHKNVVLRDLIEAAIPARPIHSGTGAQQFTVTLNTSDILKDRLARLWYDRGNFSEHLEYLKYAMATFSTPACDPDTPTTELPTDCSEAAATPKQLFERLEAWQSDYLVIPHGNSWGLYTPPGSNWRKQLTGGMNNPERQSLIEVFSGHGNSEQYRSWQSVTTDESGNAVCPEPQQNYIPCCWQAGEIIRQQCDQPDSAQCNNQVEQARQNYVEAGASGHLTVTGIGNEQWQNCGQCPDCFLPAFNMRPGTSAQASLAVSESNDEGEPQRFRFGFIGSSDNHSARPGTGYKEYQRVRMTDISASTAEWQRARPQPAPAAVASRSPDTIEADSGNVFNTLRANSFYYTGGLVAVHSEGRSRDAIWQALKNKQVYGTSGPRLLLWFDLLANGGKTWPMGSAVAQTDNPRFRVRALGAFEQKPGCPGFASDALGADRLQRLCGDECYHPSDRRLPIERLEIIKVTPQRYPDEPLHRLIEDPWKVIECDDSGDGCIAEWQDDSFNRGQRDAVYYVRAIQQATPAINGDQLRCELDAAGQCITTNPCYGDSRTDRGDDCLAPVQQRAWSSPIFVDWLKP